jgi:hypothetical protein
VQEVLGVVLVVPPLSVRFYLLLVGLLVIQAQDLLPRVHLLPLAGLEAVDLDLLR